MKSKNEIERVVEAQATGSVNESGKTSAIWILISTRISTSTLTSTLTSNQSCANANASESDCNSFLVAAVELAQDQVLDHLEQDQE